MVEQMLVGVATRQYARSLEPLPTTMVSRGTSKSAVSRRFVAKTEAQLAAWRSVQQVREAFPWDAAPRYLLHDRDLSFAGVGATAEAMAMINVLTAPRAPWQIRTLNALSDLSGASVSIT